MKLRQRQDRPSVSSVDDDLVDRTRLTFRGLTATVVLGSAGMIAITLLLAHHYGDAHLWQLAAAMAVVGCARVGTVASFNADPALI